MIEYNLDIATVDQLSKAELVYTIEYLIAHDFERLIYALYRIDVNEKKIKALLESNTNVNTAVLLADAIIERQEEKKIAREKYKQAPPDGDEGRW
jgi:hypothetical protein